MDFNNIANGSSLLDVTLVVAVPHIFESKVKDGNYQWSIDLQAHHIPMFGENAKYVSKMLSVAKKAMDDADEGYDKVLTLSSVLFSFSKKLPDKATGLSEVLQHIGETLMSEYHVIVASEYEPALKDFFQCAKYHHIKLHC